MRRRRRAIPARPSAAISAARIALLPAAVILIASGCGGSPSSGAANGATTAPGGTVTVLARSVPGVGTVLVNGQGYTLYMFVPDDRRAVTCTGSCAGTWPPLMLPSGGRVAAGAGVKPGLLGSDPDPAGGRVVTYGGWPLYTYAGDAEPGEATGQAIANNGGDWFVIRPSGRPLISEP